MLQKLPIFVIIKCAMKVLVSYIPWEDLNEIKNYFVGDGEIEFIEFADKIFKMYSSCPQPYYIEENIKNLDDLIKLTDEMEVDSATKRRVLKTRHKFIRTNKDIQLSNNYYCFRDLLLSIKKQREAGREISDIEYIYQTLKDKYNITLVNSLDLNEGYTIETQVICGQSSLGKFELFSDNPDMNFEFVFYYETEKIKRGKKKQVNGHWHPREYRDAIRDVEDFMEGNIKFKL